MTVHRTPMKWITGLQDLEEASMIHYPTFEKCFQNPLILFDDLYEDEDWYKVNTNKETGLEKELRGSFPSPPNKGK